MEETMMDEIATNRLGQKNDKSNHRTIYFERCSTSRKLPHEAMVDSNHYVRSIRQ